jgi:hypothetical protein
LIEEGDFKMHTPQNTGVPDHLRNNTKKELFAAER